MDKALNFIKRLQLPKFAQEIKNFNSITTIENDYISLTIIGNENKDTNSTIFKYCDQAYTYLCNKFYEGTYKPLRILLIMHEDKRTLPPIKRHPIDTCHINGGLCIFRPQMEYDILVYRKEDCIKVLVHEIIHFFEIDGHDKYNSEHERAFQTDMKIESTIHLGWFEAVTETYALYILCELGYYNRDKITNQIWDLARNYINHFENGNEPIQYYENTHAFMYIIGRVALWCNNCKKPNSNLLELIDNRDVYSEKVLKIISDKYPEIIKHIKTVRTKSPNPKSLRVDYRGGGKNKRRA
jgi:hypothetical protein